jgi:hypothetical protein
MSVEVKLKEADETDGRVRANLYAEYLGRGREEGTGEGMFELSNSQTLHTRTTERRKHEATPTASALSSGLPLVICFTIVDRVLLRVPCPVCFASSKYTIESTGTLLSWWVWSLDEAPPTEVHSTADLTHCQSSTTAARAFGANFGGLRLCTGMSSCLEREWRDEDRIMDQ